MRGAWTVGAASCAIGFALDDARGGLVGEVMVAAGDQVCATAALMLLEDEA